jgi:pyruvate/2-oxoglutarate/acetoin dehydrogenase E1 component/TPP-dependent pyruvate/acetoin dehydrogenase alpha subunit
MELLEFLVLECPFLIPAARRDPSRAVILKAFDDAFALQKGEAARTLYPGVTAGDAAGWTRSALRDLIEGYFRREEIKASLTPAERLELYRVMSLSRALDELMKGLFQEKKIAWEDHPSPQKGFRGFGQEAVAGLALRLRRGSEAGDIICPLIRGLPVTLMYTDDPLPVVLSQVGKKGTTFDGRDLHNGELSKGVLPPTAPLAIGTQTLVGMAYAAKLKKEDRVFLSIMGEGGTSLGEWHEAVTLATAQRLNLIFVIENNHWALGTHWSEQTAAPRFALKAAGYGIPGVTVFGNDPDEVAAASTWAAERARSGKGPALIELATYRRSGHAHHDDDRFHGAGGIKGYEVAEERALWEAADPIALYEKRLKDEGLLDAKKLAEVRISVAKRVAAVAKAAETAPWPTADDVNDRVYAERIDPTPGPASGQEKLMSYDEAIRQALIEAMERDPRVFVLGEDVGGRYGGAFGVTRGLVKQFGLERCLNTPIAESAIIGCGVGAAIAGMRPVVEMQFADFVACGFNALVNNAAKVHWRFGRAVPMVVRLPYGGATGTGGKLLGGGPYHSQCPEAWFLRVPGLKIVAPSTAADAKGLLTAAIRDNNPVIFLEAKGLYGIFSPERSEKVPVGDFEVPIGKGVIRRAGRDITVITYGAMVYVALAAAESLSRDGVELEVIDLRSIVPLDEDLVLKSVAKTHRAIVLHEDTRRGGVGAEVAALLAEKSIFDLEAPVVRVAAPDMPAPYSPPLESAYLPAPRDVIAAARAMMDR